MAEVTAWQSRPLEPILPGGVLDALRVKIREDTVVRSKAIYRALGVLPDGTRRRDIQGLWIENTWGANDLRTRGVADILVTVTDSLKGIGEALAAVFLATTLQTCNVHLSRNILDLASSKERKQLAAALKPIYAAASAEAAAAELDAFEASAWGAKFPTVVAAWRRAWDRVIPFFAFPPAVRRLVYTTNAIESTHARLRKIIKTRGNFPSDEAATKLIWLALRNITANWGRVAKEWRDSMNRPPRWASRCHVLRGGLDEALAVGNRELGASTRVRAAEQLSIHLASFRDAHFPSRRIHGAQGAWRSGAAAPIDAAGRHLHAQGRTNTPRIERLFAAEGCHLPPCCCSPGDIYALVVRARSVPDSVELTDIRLRPVKSPTEASALPRLAPAASTLPQICVGRSDRPAR